MTQEEKAKRYDEAIERANELNYVSDKNSLQHKTVEHIFPELKDSEDERIRKRIIHALHGDILDIEETKKAIAWLEKQGEQKPADKAEPKFKIGDFIVNDYCMGKVVEITNDAYLLDTEQGIPFSSHSIRLWDITKDAKDGDVLTYNDSKNNVWVCIFKEYANERVYDYCTLDKESFWEYSNWNYLASFSYTPATKEQRDLLFKKMHEAGYEWDAEKKELKKIITPIFKIGDTIRDKNTNDKFIITNIVLSLQYYHDANHLHEIPFSEQDNYELVEQKPVEWSEEDEAKLKSILFHIEDVENKDVIDWLKSLKDRVILQPKQEWSDEDEKIRQSLIKYFNKQLVDTNYEGVYANNIYKWLKSIKDRVLPQPKQDWSEEDESMRIRCIGALYKCYMGELPATVVAEIDWLKSLRSQSHWKPSEEQIECLSDAIKHYNSLGYPASKLKELLEQLKKLREE